MVAAADYFYLQRRKEGGMCIAGGCDCVVGTQLWVTRRGPSAWRVRWSVQSAEAVHCGEYDVRLVMSPSHAGIYGAWSGVQACGSSPGGCGCVVGQSAEVGWVKYPLVRSWRRAGRGRRVYASGANTPNKPLGH